MLLEEMMTKLQTARRAILAVAAVLAAAPLRGARAQAGRALEDLHGQTAHKRDIARAQGKARA
jgi:hypothetical protein